jgi:hypothetical protein
MLVVSCKESDRMLSDFKIGLCVHGTVVRPRY